MKVVESEEVKPAKKFMLLDVDLGVFKIEKTKVEKLVAGWEKIRDDPGKDLDGKVFNDIIKHLKIHPKELRKDKKHPFKIDPLDDAYVSLRDMLYKRLDFDPRIKQTQLESDDKED